MTPSACRNVQSLDEVLSRLRQARSLRFDARSEAATGWNGTGNGTVAISEPAAGVVVFDETGIWQPADPDRPPTRFKNVFRWSAVGASLRLEHLRFGHAHPVQLFDMTGGTWREIGAHLCREDRYTASLGIEDGRLVVAWSIVGPRKRESIRYVYW